MPGERRNLRSNKELTSSASGEKGRADSQNAKDKAAPSRSTSSKAKTSTARKNSKGANSDKPKINGSPPTENGVNGVEDVEMEGDGPDKGKPQKDGDDEMTVVVPPPNSTKLSADPEKDDEGDLSMEDAQQKDGPGKERADALVKVFKGNAKPPNLLNTKHVLTLIQVSMPISASSSVL